MDGTVIAANDYYPYGKRINTASATTPTQRDRHTFSGKEDQALTPGGAPYLDFGARMYSPETGRWLSVDPMAEKYYGIGMHVYCAGNPVNVIDPDGKDWFLSDEYGVCWTDYQSQQEMNDNGLIGRYLGKVFLDIYGSRNESLGHKYPGDKGYDYKHTDGYMDAVDAVNAKAILYGSSGPNDISNLVAYTMTSDPSIFGAIAEGEYEVNYMEQGKGGALPSNWAINKGYIVPSMDGKPNLSPKAKGNYNLPQYTGVYIHSSNSSGWAGKTEDGGVSTACILLNRESWLTFLSVLKQANVKEFRMNLTRSL